MAQRALTLYREGLDLSQAKKFAEAARVFQEAVSIDPQFHEAYEELAYVLYCLKRYEESAEASKAAIRLHADFKPFYNLGLVHYATENWYGAMLAFRRSIELRNQSSWKDEYTEAYYYLGRSLAKLGDVHKEIRALETEGRFLEGNPIKRFELANLYLCFGWKEAAKEQHRLLNDSAPSLAKELLKLMKKHGVRRPA
jgi:tetratricopeptide (TPR) repeat protein